MVVGRVRGPIYAQDLRTFTYVWKLILEPDPQLQGVFGETKHAMKQIADRVPWASLTQCGGGTAPSHSKHDAGRPPGLCT
jgi:hypothetical protein